MVDRNHDDFVGRLGRINKVHDSGGGFEATGTLSKAYYRPRRFRMRRPKLIGILVMTGAVLVFLKATLQVTLGPDAYDYKVALLKKGNWADHAGAFVLQTDPVTDAVAIQLRRLTRTPLKN